uniref:Uncharacterized protein n=1 Tax=Cryptococcus bacillisporus CA1280 TaxID=1296109 RepID=A0A0D0TS59_CRYGA|nr:hypothetical protein I312_01665 [Cryptococcus bacillisporus CA1280]
MSAYPSVWAMLVVHGHALNTDKDRKVLFSHETIYSRSGMDMKLEVKDSTAVLQCEEGDLVVAHGPYQPETFYIHLVPLASLVPKAPSPPPPLTSPSP